ncbi:MAG: ribonuclease III [Burkholderiales bacterium]|nr:ribonuclease III [Burkholderiales bacterium]
MKRDALEEALGHRFANPALLAQALTHRSHSSPHNERLEFLGDSVLNFVVAAELYGRFPGLEEGRLTRLRASLVREESLHGVALRLALGDHLRLGKGALKSGDFRRASVLADALEAVFGAVFLDGGYDAVRATIVRLFEPLLASLDPAAVTKDAKTRLQEWLQGHRYALPQYAVVATHGAGHNQQFEVECVISELDIRTVGTGASRRTAEQDAARQAYARVEP